MVAGQQFGYTFDDIGNRTSTAAGGDQFGENQRPASYSANSLNQYTSRTVPGAVDVIGSATNLSTVTVNNTPTYRHSDYFRAELPLANAAGAVWQSVTNLAVLQQGTNADIIDTPTYWQRVLLPSATESYSYDADGNLTQDGRWAYAWDAENRLLNMTSLSGNPSGSKLKLDFVYDYRSRRVQKIVSAWGGSSYAPQSTNRFSYDGWNLIAILDSQSSILSSFTWGLDLSGSKQGAGGVGGLLAVTLQYAPTNQQQFISFDGNGNVTSLADSSTAAITRASMNICALLAARRSSAPRGLWPNSTHSGSRRSFRMMRLDLCYYGYRYLNNQQG